jgi:hypothetical protein
MVDRRGAVIAMLLVPLANRAQTQEKLSGKFSTLSATSFSFSLKIVGPVDSNAVFLTVEAGGTEVSLTVAEVMKALKNE